MVFNMFDLVKVTKGGRTIKEGIIVRLTNAGARVYNLKAKDEPPFSDSIEFAEWFPFSSENQQISLIRAYKEKPADLHQRV